MPRTQVTICGAPNAIAIPRIAPRHHPHDIRFAIAMPPRTMIKMIAIGVSQARMLVCRALAPVMKGEACARQSSGAQTMSAMTRADNDIETRVTVRRWGWCMAKFLLLSGTEDGSSLDLGLHLVELMFGPACKLFAFHLARRAEPESLYDE